MKDISKNVIQQAVTKNNFLKMCKKYCSHKSIEYCEDSANIINECSFDFHFIKMPDILTTEEPQKPIDRAIEIAVDIMNQVGKKPNNLDHIKTFFMPGQIAAIENFIEEKKKFIIKRRKVSMRDNDGAVCNYSKDYIKGSHDMMETFIKFVKDRGVK